MAGWIKVHGSGARAPEPWFKSSSVKPPVACADFAAGHAGAGIGFAAAIGGFGEFAAHPVAAAEFAGGGEGAAIAAIAPFIGTADIAVQAVGIDAIGHGLVVAVD